MAILKKVKKCSHCGAILQSEDKEALGYIDALVLKRYPDGVLLCNNCFEEEKKVTNEIILNDEFKSVLKTIRDTHATVVYVIDLFSFEGGFPSEVTTLLNDVDVIAVGNKRDLIPKDVDDNELISYLRHRLKMAGLKVNDIVLTSSSKNYNIELLTEKIQDIAKGDVYFVGSATSGRSALIFEILKNYKNYTDQYIITYNFPETTLSGFKIPLSKTNAIYEVPGFPISNSLLGILDKPLSNYIVPKKEVEARKVTLSDKVSLAFGGLCFIQQLNEGKTPLSCYLSDKIQIKTKRGDPIKFFKSVLKNGTQENTSFKFRDLALFDVYDFEITETGERDVGILGLGWFQFSGNNQKIRIFVPKGVYVYTTRAKLKNVK